MSVSEELNVLLEQGKSETVEFKGTPDNEALETVAAFANTRGGALLIGVADDGKMRGVTLGKETLRDWANRIAQATHLHPQIRSCTCEDKSIVLVVGVESPLKPIPCRGLGGK